MADDHHDLIETSTGGGIGGSLPARKAIPIVVAPATDNEKNTFQDPLVVVACWRMDDVRFEFNSSFVGPDAREEMQLLGIMRKKNPKAPLSVFGHADPIGDDSYNKKLSGRRARVIFGMLTRDVKMWEDLFSNQDGTQDKWGDPAIQKMRSTLGITDTSTTTPGTRATLFKAYMDKLCQDPDGKSFEISKSDFLSKGADTDGRGDLQGCSEFNPVLMFSKSENEAFNASADKTARNQENAPNRRVMILFFKPDSRIDLKKWPCPAARDPGIGKCVNRFWSDHLKRRSFQAQRRLVESTRDTFACRFYDRLTQGSPCEGAKKLITFKVVFQRFPGVGGKDEDRGIGEVPFKLRVTGLPDKEGKTEKDGTVKVVMPAGSAVLLDIFGSSYELNALDAIEKLDTIEGVQRRLDMLGYHAGAINGTVGVETDDAVLKLQADNNKNPDGDATQAVDPSKPYGKDTQDLLKAIVGE